MPKLKPFITLEGPLFQEKYNNQIKKMKRLSDLKAEQERSEQELRRMFNQATLKAQAHKWTKHEAKKVKMMEEFNHQISFNVDPLSITKMSYVVNPNKEATMKIVRGENPLNLIIHPNFILKTLGFSEWLEIYALAAKKTRKLNDMLLQSLRTKFQWVINQAKKLGLPPPPALATFGITTEERKRKRAEIIKEVFVTEDIRVDGMERNLIPPLGSCQFRDLLSVNLMEYAEVLRRVRGGNTLTILSPFGEEQAELELLWEFMQDKFIKLIGGTIRHLT
ncbi:hypothetical protein Tco_0671502 [Tanacetum coccineum]